MRDLYVCSNQQTERGIDRMLARKLKSGGFRQGIHGCAGPGTASEVAGCL